MSAQGQTARDVIMAKSAQEILNEVWNEKLFEGGVK
jgi:hypothetical protein